MSNTFNAVCKHCNKYIYCKDNSLWQENSGIYPQYCWVDPGYGSQLHSPILNERDFSVPVKFKSD
jgi:hypothetical protein